MPTRAVAAPRAYPGASGFTLIELQIAVAVFIILAGVSVWGLSDSISNARADSATAQVVSLLRRGHDAALTQGRLVVVRFTPPNRIALAQQDLPNGETIIAQVGLEHGAQFGRDAAVPDTPDQYGKNLDIDFGGAAVVQFTPDGTLTDANEVPLNGTIFLRIPRDPVSVRAVTVTGASARPQPYRWNGAYWEAR